MNLSGTDCRLPSGYTGSTMATTTLRLARCRAGLNSRTGTRELLQSRDSSRVVDRSQPYHDDALETEPRGALLGRTAQPALGAGGLRASRSPCKKPAKIGTITP